MAVAGEVSIARVIAESKLRRKVDFKKMHPRERDFWMARAQQALNNEAHGWAVAEASK
jgi:hypothetical protein